MENTFSERAKDFAIESSDGKNRYIDVQSANWVILSEQGEKEAALETDSQMMKLITAQVWIYEREGKALALSQIRDKDRGTTRSLSSRAFHQLSRYVSDPKHWWSASQILPAHANSN